ncbi:F-box/kelch-repeat protein At3g06240-like [Cornus florida]|uniref:F-box/kelch-repeat protein At3g06240-like n=1 Tax=Cornus florida TaxID=4283 RepID=UPI00289B53F9|nr:F-box/kelch-repeat protein At3g06240-like [Cornus florida]
MKSSCFIIGSCHGLLCSKFRRTGFYVSNLSTKESKRIPEPEVKFWFWDDFCCVMGFGYDHSVDDYKLVTADKKSFYVYSLRTDSWKKVQGLPNSHKNGAIPVAPGVPLNGAIHWIYNDRGSIKIVAFCLADEKFWEFPDPIPSMEFIDALGLLGGCLCITPYNNGRELWVMKEYGVAQAWTKVAIEIPCYRIRLLALLENHEVILKIDSEKLVLYNSRERTYRYLVLRNFPDVENCTFEGAYVESMVSPCHGSLS